MLGFTRNDQVLLDYDASTFARTVREARRLAKRFMLGAFLVSRSSAGSYHVVFARKVSYAKACRVIDASSCKSQQNPTLRALRGDTTLRVGPIRSKNRPRLPPVPVWLQVNGREHLGGIFRYLDALELANGLAREGVL